MQSAENGFKKHHLIPFSKKIPGAVAASLTSRKEKCLASSPLCRKENIPIRVLSTSALKIMANNEILQKKKMKTQSAKMSQIAPFASFFFEKFLGEVPDPAPLQRDRSDVRLQPPSVVDLVCGSVTDNAMYIFNAILLKIQQSLSELKRLHLHSRLHHFVSFFQNFLGGGPPNPHRREGTPLPYPPHSALRDSRKPPRLRSGSATVMLYFSHWFLEILYIS